MVNVDWMLRKVVLKTAGAFREVLKPGAGALREVGYVQTGDHCCHCYRNRHRRLDVPYMSQDCFNLLPGQLIYQSIGQVLFAKQNKLKL